MGLQPAGVNSAMILLGLEHFVGTTYVLSVQTEEAGLFQQHICSAEIFC